MYFLKSQKLQSLMRTWLIKECICSTSFHFESNLPFVWSFLLSDFRFASLSCNILTRFRSFLFSTFSRAQFSHSLMVFWASDGLDQSFEITGGTDIGSCCSSDETALVLATASGVIKTFAIFDCGSSAVAARLIAAFTVCEKNISLFKKLNKKGNWQIKAENIRDWNISPFFFLSWLHWLTAVSQMQQPLHEWMEKGLFQSRLTWAMGSAKSLFLPEHPGVERNLQVWNV